MKQEQVQWAGGCEQRVGPCITRRNRQTSRNNDTVMKTNRSASATILRLLCRPLRPLLLLPPLPLLHQHRAHMLVAVPPVGVLAGGAAVPNRAAGATQTGEGGAETSVGLKATSGLGAAACAQEAGAEAEQSQSCFVPTTPSLLPAHLQRLLPPPGPASGPSGAATLAQRR